MSDKWGRGLARKISMYWDDPDEYGVFSRETIKSEK